MLTSLFSKSRELSKPPSVQAGALTKSEHLALRYITLGLTTGLAGYLVSGIFLSAFYYPEFWNVSGLIVAAYRIFRNSKSEEASLVLGSTFTENGVQKKAHPWIPVAQWSATQK
jgi:hypothetical protein